MSTKSKKSLPAARRAQLLTTLQARFESNMSRHADLAWSDVRARLVADAGKLWSLNEMEETGGEPDVVGRVSETGEIVFYDCSPESPKERRNTCYDRAGQEAREKEGLHPGSALDMAAAMGIEMLSEDEYRALQRLGSFDSKTSTWVKTPADIRKLGGALFCDRRYGHVFVYHNGAQSFYSGRGFRGLLRV
jgi:hypothetical protein